jgi:hypothetical protein
VRINKRVAKVCGEVSLLNLLRGREQDGASAEEVRAQYHAAELSRLYDQLSLQQQQALIDGLIKTFRSKRR